MPSNKFKTKFPPARIKKIMQTDEEVGKVAAAVPVIVSKSLELFTEIFLQKSGQIATDRGARTLSIEHIKECVDAEQKFDFLREIVKEAAAKAVGKTGEESSAGASLHPAPSQSESLPNGTKDTSLSTTKTDLNALRQQRKRMMKMEESPGTSSTFPTSSPAGSSSFLPSRNQPSVSSTSVITKVEKRPFPVKKEYSWLKTETNEADDEGEEEQFAARKKRSKCNSVVDGLVVPNQETRFSAKEKMKLHSPSMRVVEGVKKSGMPQSVIVKRDLVSRSQSHNEVQAHSRQSFLPEGTFQGSNAKSAPSSAPASLPPSSMQFMYGNSASLYSQPVMAYPPASPLEATTFPYTPQAMMMMMQHQQEAREAFQYQMYAQHEQRLLEESSARIPTTYPCPRDFFSSEPVGRSVIVPTAEAQDLRINRPVDTLTASGSHGQRFQSYHGDRDGPY